jgi:hypothetical protein
VLRVIKIGAKFLGLIHRPLDIGGIHSGTSVRGSPHHAVTKLVLALFLRASVTSADACSQQILAQVNHPEHRPSNRNSGRGRKLTEWTTQIPASWQCDAP